VKAACLAAAAAAALLTAGTAAGRTALLPSPTTPIDTSLPLGADSVTVPPLLPAVNGRAASDERVTVDVLRDGTVVRVRAVQRLTLTGTGDFFFQVPAPLLDVRAAPSSQAEPGFRRNAILWQGFANRRRLLASDADLEPAATAPVLPLRLQLSETGSLQLRNTTAVSAQAFRADARSEDVRRMLTGIVARPTVQPSVDVSGPVQGRRVVVEAPLLVRGEIRSRGRTVLRFSRVVGGPSAANVRVAPPSPVPDPEVALTARPVRLLPELHRLPAGADSADLVLLGGRSLLRLARVHQYNSFLANPDPSGPSKTVYSFRTVVPTAALPADRSGSGGSPALAILFAAGAVLASGGLVVLWAHA
jgi:hypothetical protein